ncbi:hypothetical protein GS426_07375 [Rhodococcus hoagii]|nr:hypothetical protein [Prescottella equi]
MGRAHVAVTQLAPRLLDFEANADMTVDAIASARERGADIVVLPELCLSGYMFDTMDEARSCAITPEHPVFARWARALAGSQGLVVGGFCRAIGFPTSHQRRRRGSDGRPGRLSEDPSLEPGEAVLHRRHRGPSGRRHRLRSGGCADLLRLGIPGDGKESRDARRGSDRRADQLGTRRPPVRGRTATGHAGPRGRSDEPRPRRVRGPRGPRARPGLHRRLGRHRHRRLGAGHTGRDRVRRCRPDVDHGAGSTDFRRQPRVRGPQTRTVRRGVPNSRDRMSCPVPRRTGADGSATGGATSLGT